MTASVWDDVVGQPAAVAALQAAAGSAGPRLPLRRTVGFDEARRGAGVRRRCC